MSTEFLEQRARLWRRNWASAAGLVAALLLCQSAPASAASDGAVVNDLDLVGTWYVLVHYKDSDSAHPDRDRWEDRLWVFDKRGSRLNWTEYPIVVFSDREGRFERTEYGQTRVLHKWYPNAAQLKQIQSGLEFNSRGSKKKALRRKKSGVWQSMANSVQMSASSVGYHETWSVAPSDSGPVFTRDDVLGSLQTESMSGRTRYAATKVRKDGTLVKGDFARDDSRRGTFRMMRAGAVKSVGTKRSTKERSQDALEGGRRRDRSEAVEPKDIPDALPPEE